MQLPRDYPKLVLTWLTDRLREKLSYLTVRKEAVLAEQKRKLEALHATPKAARRREPKEPASDDMHQATNAVLARTELRVRMLRDESDAVCHSFGLQQSILQQEMHMRMQQQQYMQQQQQHSSPFNTRVLPQFQVWQPPPTSTDQRLAQHGYPGMAPGAPAHHASGLRTLSQRTPFVSPEPPGLRVTQRQFEAPRAESVAALGLVDYTA